MTDNQSPSKALLITVLSLCLGLVFNWLFFGKIVGLSYPLFTAVTLLSYFGLSLYFKTKPTKSAWGLGFVILVLASFVAIRESMALTFFNVVASFFLLLVLAGLSSGRKLGDFEIIDYLRAIFILPFQFVASIPTVIANLFVSPGARQGSKMYSVIRGLVITLPILIVFILLFSSADLVFQKYLGKVFDFDLSEIFPRFILISLVTFAFVGAFGYLFQKMNNPVPQSPQSRSNIGLTEVKILFGAINILFLIFIVVQIAYLFGGEENIAKLGFTYADYARKGFFELIAVAAFSLFLVFAVERHVPRVTEKHTASFKFLSAALILEVVLIMVSSFKRLLLYENVYGFTADRFYAHALTIGLGLIFLLLLYKILTDQKENRFVFSSFVLTILFLIGLNLFNPDLFIAKQNIDQRLAQNEPGKLDTAYLQTLSTDATSQIVRLLDFPDIDIQYQYQVAFVLKSDRDNASGHPWQSFHFGRKKALSVIEANRSR
ncbi:MAG: DUF4173 domain-containing protein, partial [bacterium]|nr:DUF4173 domain-containing protein [bacterium]